MALKDCTPSELTAIGEAMAARLGMRPDEYRLALDTLRAMEAQGSVAVDVFDARISITILEPASLANEPWLVVERGTRRLGGP